MVEKSLALMKSQPELSEDELRKIATPVLVMSGDDDVRDWTTLCDVRGDARSATGGRARCLAQCS